MYLCDSLPWQVLFWLLNSNVTTSRAHSCWPWVVRNSASERHTAVLPPLVRSGEFLFFYDAMWRARSTAEWGWEDEWEEWPAVLFAHGNKRWNIARIFQEVPFRYAGFITTSPGDLPGSSRLWRHVVGSGEVTWQLLHGPDYFATCVPDSCGHGLGCKVYIYTSAEDDRLLVWSEPYDNLRLLLMGIDICCTLYV